MVLYKFKEPKHAEHKSKTEPKKTSYSKESKDSSYHYDYMKQLMKQKNGTKSAKIQEQLNRFGMGGLTKHEWILFIELFAISVAIICGMIVAGYLLSDHSGSDTDITQVKQTATVESYSNVVSEYSRFEGMQENGLPEKWIATVDEDHKYIDFKDLAKEYEYRDVTRSLSFTVTEGNKCIVYPIYDNRLETSWPAYDLCKDSSTKTYNLIVHVQDFSDELGTVQLVLTVEK